MTQSPLGESTKVFALSIMRICDEIRRNRHEPVLTAQLLRPGTAIGANVRTAAFAETRDEFVGKLHIALKECAECEYWLELLLESSYYTDPEPLNKCREIKNMLLASVNTAKNGREK